MGAGIRAGWSQHRVFPTNNLAQCTGMRTVGLVVDLLHVGFCTTMDSGFDVGGRRGRCGGRYAECIMINGIRAWGVEE
jgi:hypothetical protein